MPSARERLYRRHRFPPEVISYAVWLYFRFPLSLRMVEEILAARGICVTVRRQRLGDSGRFSRREDFWIIVAARSEDETEIRAGETTGGRCNQGPTGDASTLFGRGEDPRRAGRAPRRGEHCRTVSPRGHRLVDVLWLVERVP